MDNLLNKTISRRNFLTASASIAGLGALSANIGLGLFTASDANDQKKFLSEILNRYTGHSEKIQPQYIALFADRFTEVYGVVDYKAYFAGPIGEFRLIKLFLRSVFRSA